MKQEKNECSKIWWVWLMGAALAQSCVSPIIFFFKLIESFLTIINLTMMNLFFTRLCFSKLQKFFCTPKEGQKFFCTPKEDQNFFLYTQGRPKIFLYTQGRPKNFFVHPRKAKNFFVHPRKAKIPRQQHQQHKEWVKLYKQIFKWWLVSLLVASALHDDTDAFI